MAARSISEGALENCCRIPRSASKGKYSCPKFEDVALPLGSKKPMETFLRLTRAQRYLSIRRVNRPHVSVVGSRWRLTCSRETPSKLLSEAISQRRVDSEAAYDASDLSLGVGRWISKERRRENDISFERGSNIAHQPSANDRPTKNIPSRLKSKDRCSSVPSIDRRTSWTIGTDLSIRRWS